MSCCPFCSSSHLSSSVLFDTFLDPGMKQEEQKITVHSAHAHHEAPSGPPRRNQISEKSDRYQGKQRHQLSVCGSIPGSNTIYSIINQSIFFHFCSAKHGHSLPMQITVKTPPLKLHVINKRNIPIMRLICSYSAIFS